jgi:hypothetical protein
MISGSSSKKTTVSHVNLCSDEEKEENSEEEKEEDSVQTLSELMKSARETSKKAKKVSFSIWRETLLSISARWNFFEEASSKKHGKGKDISKIAIVLRAQKAKKVDLRPISRAKYFDFASLKTKGWNLREYTDSQGWSNFISLQEHTYEDLLREFYANMTVKEKKNENEKFLISTVKGVQIKVTQDFLSKG